MQVNEISSDNLNKFKKKSLIAKEKYKKFVFVYNQNLMKIKTKSTARKQDAFINLVYVLLTKTFIYFCFSRFYFFVTTENVGDLTLS
jgi:hypothetical protein